jgi:outer membrane immunogenic protein
MKNNCLRVFASRRADGLTRTKAALWIVPIALFWQGVQAETPATVAVTKAAPSIPWTGFYAGGNAGVMLNYSEVNANHIGFVKSPISTEANSTAFIPGLQAGYLKQLESNYVIGVEVDFTYPDASGNSTLSCGACPGAYDKFTVKNRVQGSIRARLGYPFHQNQWLPYITAGVSFADTALRYSNDRGDAYSKDTAQTGLVLGTGLEYRVDEPLSVRAEYLYTDYGNALNLDIPTVDGAFDPSGKAKADLASHVIRVAVNYWF